jgi:hypothetical protein
MMPHVHSRNCNHEHEPVIENIPQPFVEKGTERIIDCDCNYNSRGSFHGCGEWKSWFIKGYA